MPEFRCKVSLMTARDFPESAVAQMCDAFRSSLRVEFGGDDAARTAYMAHEEATRYRGEGMRNEHREALSRWSAAWRRAYAVASQYCPPGLPMPQLDDFAARFETET